jgi:hypothetical protein
MVPHQERQQQQQAPSAKGGAVATPEAEAEPEDLLGAPTAHFVAAAALFDKLRLEFTSLTSFRNKTLAQLEGGHLKAFTSDDDDRLKHIVEDLASHATPMENPLFKALDEVTEAQAAFEAVQASVAQGILKVPEEHIEANSVLVNHPDLAKLVAERDAGRNALMDRLNAFFDMVKAYRLDALIEENVAVAAEIQEIVMRTDPTAVSMEVTEAKPYEGVVALGLDCLAKVNAWEKEVGRRCLDDRAWPGNSTGVLVWAVLSGGEEHGE